MMTKFLYGASVQGIQSFVFQTNKLKDIIGASELVNEICERLFKDVVGQGYKEDCLLMGAAGNVKYLFDNENDCQETVRQFPMKVSLVAPGITVSQAVVKTDGSDIAAAIETLEQRLRAQRNRPQRSVTLGAIGIRRSRQTGLPAVKKEVKQGNEEFLDASTLMKRRKVDVFSLARKAFGENVDPGRLVNEIDKLTDKNNWVAVIHADGNGLGKIVQEIGHDSNTFKAFSRHLEEATVTAARQAYSDMERENNFGEVIPIRPIVIGGDDFTVVCRADIAIGYATAFMRYFEQNTEAMMTALGVTAFPRLTACAGIAFTGKAYPFYYAYDLAEMLCSQAKKDAKQEDRLVDGLASSCLMFHKVQDSYVSSYDDIIRRELTPAKGYTYQYGPYYLNRQPGRMTIAELMEYPKTLNQDNREENAIKTHVREWMSTLQEYGAAKAEQQRQRLHEIIAPRHISLADSLLAPREDGAGSKAVACYDILSLCSVMNKTTR